MKYLGRIILAVIVRRRFWWLLASAARVPAAQIRRFNSSGRFSLNNRGTLTPRSIIQASHQNKATTEPWQETLLVSAVPRKAGERGGIQGI